jgi:hypothetical protein
MTVDPKTLRAINARGQPMIEGVNPYAYVKPAPIDAAPGNVHTRGLASDPDGKVPLAWGAKPAMPENPVKIIGKVSY